MLAVLEVQNLSVEFAGRRRTLLAIDNVSFSIGGGETLGVVGESGAGKSLTGASIIGLLEPPGRISAGRILLEGVDIARWPDRKMRTIRGRRIGIVFQDPLTSLHPLFTIGRQLVDTIRSHLPLSKSDAEARALELLREVGIAGAEQRLAQYPHQFSGGMRQRVVIALALAADPKLIIADEPTTALDVSVQAQIIALLKSLCLNRGAAVMLISHDMGLMAQAADRIAVLYAGRIVESGPTASILSTPAHPYTQGLIRSIPRMESDRKRLGQIGGAMPHLESIPIGCSFWPRCEHAIAVCRQSVPPLLQIRESQVACWLYNQEKVAKERAVLR
jgi:peptide/nickel transport system ATP-binding protein